MGDEGGRRVESVHARLRAAARACPDALAVADRAVRLTFAELDACAAGFARRLRAAGVGPGVPVALCHERSVAAVVGALAVWKAGGAYVPLDPVHPDARLVATVRDARIRFALATGANAERLAPAGATQFDLAGIASIPGVGGAGGAGAPDDVAAADDVAYVMHTSGSTGAPKGVQVTHANLSQLVDWHTRAFAVGPDDRASWIASPAFDASVWETWPALVAGASLHVPDAAVVAAPERLRDWLVAEQITIAFVPTPLAEILVALPWPATTALRTMLTGGDLLHHWPPPGLPFTLVNNYGVTEATVVSTSGVVAPLDRDRASRLPSIGGAIDGTRVYVVDADGLPVHAGDAGELWIGGAGVALGYFARPDLTAQRFGPDPFVDDPTARVYRTGDVVRATAGGEYEFLGRLDDQVQVRGQRVEVDEIAVALSIHPTVDRSIVLPRRRGAHDAPLVAYVVPAAGAIVDRSELRAHLASRLPAAMVPCAFVVLDEFPLTTNGKVDRDALPAPDVDVHPEQVGRTAVERSVGAILEDLLALPAVGRDDNFFELGGHSLMAAQLVARLEEQFDIELELLAVFDNPTTAGIAAVIEGDAAALHSVSE